MPRDRKSLSLESLSEVDGGAIAHAFDMELRKLQLDLEDRPDLKTARKITLELSLVPVNDRSQLTRTDIGFVVKATIPPKKSISYPFAPTAEGLGFYPDVPDNPNQRPLQFDSGE